MLHSFWWKLQVRKQLHRLRLSELFCKPRRIEPWNFKLIWLEILGLEILQLKILQLKVYWWHVVHLWSLDLRGLEKLVKLLRRRRLCSLKVSEIPDSLTPRWQCCKHRCLLQ